MRIKYLILLIFLILIPDLIWCQIIKPLEWKAEIEKIDNKTFKIILTVSPDSNLYTISLFQDTSGGRLIPTTISLRENKNLNPLGEWIESPKVLKSHHEALFTDGLFLKEKTNYSRKFSLKNKENFTSIFDLEYWCLNDHLAITPDEIQFKITYAKDILKIRQVKKHE